MKTLTHNSRGASIWIAVIAFLFVGLSGIAGAQTQTSAKPELPKDIKWITNTTDPVWSDPKAKKGGTYRSYITTFPLTLRTVGPDSNDSFASVRRELNFGLVMIHPNTLNVIPGLATHWAYSKDKTTMYFKLDKDAKWTDGKPVTAKDYQYTLEFMRSKHIVAPWYNRNYTEFFDKIIAFDDYTIAVVSPKPLAEPELFLNIKPTPKHYYGTLDKDFVKKYNWDDKVPGTGPYVYDKIRKGKTITLKRKKNWWGENKLYYKNRFNANKLVYTVIREDKIAFAKFQKGEIDNHSIIWPDFWHEKSITDAYKKGYIHRLWAYNDSPASPYGIYLNTAKPIFKDKNVRLGVQHSMNVQKVIDTILRGDYYRLENLISGYNEYTNNNIRARKYDLKKAAEYFAKAGYTKRDKDGILVNSKGEKLQFSLTYSSPKMEPRLVILKEEALKAGVRMNLNKMDGSAAFKSFLEKQHEAAWMAWTTNIRPTYWQGYHSDNANKPQTNNITNTSIPAMDKLIEKYRDSVDKKERAELSVQIQQYLHDHAAVVPLFDVPFYREAHWAWIKLPKEPGTKLSPTALDPADEVLGGVFWIDTDLKKKVMAAKKKKQKWSEPVTKINETFMRASIRDSKSH